MCSKEDPPSLDMAQLHIFSSLRNNQDQPVNAEMLFLKVSLNVVWQMVAGERFGYDDARMEDLLKLILVFNQFAVEVLSGTIVAFPFLE